MLSEEDFLALKRARQLDWPSPHFTMVDVSSIKQYKKKISDWIWVNCTGRFWIGETYQNRQYHLHVGFENPAEASYFALKFLSNL